MEIYLVGGAVRDQLLGYPIMERDYVVVGTSPAEMLKQGFRLIGNDFPVFLHPKTHEEYALARTERKIGPGYKGFTCYAAPDVTLEDDLQRRDLTINAMAQTDSGQIIDPFQGQKDIGNKLLRHVSSAFSEDPVRVLRVARFMARFAPLGFRVAKETMGLMKNMVSAGEMQALVPERVWQEFSKALTEPAPQAFIKILYNCDALAVLFPEIQELYTQNRNVKQRTLGGQHSYLSVLEKAVALTNDPQVRFAAILCDLGKGVAKEETQTGIHLIQALCQRYRIPHAYVSLAITAAAYHLLCHRALDLDAPSLYLLLEKTDAFRQSSRLDQFLLVCEADFQAYSGLANTLYLQKVRVLSAFAVAKKVSANKIKKSGITGAALGKKLIQQRIQAISDFLQKI
ncbi:MAG: multifunctional CCA addition/repair protein [Candidatus Aquirickettsiella sp.]